MATIITLQREQFVAFFTWSSLPTSSASFGRHCDLTINRRCFAWIHGWIYFSLAEALLLSSQIPPVRWKSENGIHK
jgi:hypothetical protein